MVVSAVQKLKITYLSIHLYFLPQPIFFTNDHGYVPFVVITIRSFPHSWIITWFVARVTRRVPHMGQELLTLTKHLSSPPIFWGGGRVCVARSLVFCVMFCRSLFIPLSFSFGHYMFFFDLRLLINLLVSPNFSSWNLLIKQTYWIATNILYSTCCCS